MFQHKVNEALDDHIKVVKLKNLTRPQHLSLFSLLLLDNDKQPDKKTKKF